VDGHCGRIITVPDRPVPDAHRAGGRAIHATHAADAADAHHSGITDATRAG
jgi:hypothetical protein